MVKCSVCGCNCDPGDLRGGVCEDCREEERKQEKKITSRMSALAAIYAERQDGQMMIIGGSKK